MELRIDFGEPIIKEELVLSIQPNDLDDFYVTASDFDKSNLFFVLLTSLHHFEESNDTQRAAHLSFLIAYYLFIPLTPPGSFYLALHYINKAISLNPVPQYEEWLELIKKGTEKQTKPKTVTLDRLPNTAGRRSFILPKGGQTRWTNHARNWKKSTPKSPPNWRYLKEHRSTVWAELVMDGRLYAHLLEVEDAANDLLDSMMPDMAKAAGATEELKARDPMNWGADEQLQGTC